MADLADLIDTRIHPSWSLIFIMDIIARYGSVTLKDNSATSLADNKYHTVWIRRPSRKVQVSKITAMTMMMIYLCLFHVLGLPLVNILFTFLVLQVLVDIFGIFGKKHTFAVCTLLKYFSLWCICVCISIVLVFVCFVY